jgi:hypothetical protein
VLDTLMTIRRLSPFLQMENDSDLFYFLYQSQDPRLMCLTITAEINNESCCGFKLGNPQFDYIYILVGGLTILFSHLSMSKPTTV